MNFALKCWLKPPKVIAKYTEIRNTEIFTVEVYIRKQLFLSLRKQCVARIVQRQVDSHVSPFGLRAAEMRWQQSSTALRKKLFLNLHCNSKVVLCPEKVEVMVYQKMLRSLVGCVPRYIKLETTSTAAPLM